MAERISERQLAGERRLEERRQRAIRRTPAVVSGLLVGLTLLAGIAAAVDLRRLATPAGTTTAWVQAALSANCARYAELSAPPSGRALPLTAAQCRLLRTASARLPGRSAAILIRGVVRLPGHRADADVTVVTDGLPPRAATIELRRDAGGWRVLRTPSSCELASCP